MDIISQLVLAHYTRKDDKLEETLGHGPVTVHPPSVSRVIDQVVRKVSRNISFAKTVAFYAFSANSHLIRTASCASAENIQTVYPT